MPDKPLTEKQIKKIVQMEIKSCFEQLTSDVKEIKQALLGSDYSQEGGLIGMVRSHEDYIEHNRITRVAERGLAVIEWYEDLNTKKGTDSKSELERLQDGIATLQTVGTLKKWVTFFGISNVVAAIALILDNLL